MRTTSFLLGALAGVTAAVYLGRNRNMRVMLNGLRDMDADQMFGKAKNFANNMMQNSSHSDHKAKDAGGDLGKVKDIVQQDSHLKHHVDEILSENNRPASMKQ